MIRKVAVSKPLTTSASIGSIETFRVNLWVRLCEALHLLADLAPGLAFRLAGLRA